MDDNVLSQKIVVSQPYSVNIVDSQDTIDKLTGKLDSSLEETMGDDFQGDFDTLLQNFETVYNNIKTAIQENYGASENQVNSWVNLISVMENFKTSAISSLRAKGSSIADSATLPQIVTEFLNVIANNSASDVEAIRESLSETIYGGLDYFQHYTKTELLGTKVYHSGEITFEEGEVSESGFYQYENGVLWSIRTQLESIVKQLEGTMTVDVGYHHYDGLYFLIHRLENICDNNDNIIQRFADFYIKGDELQDEPSNVR